MEERPRLSLQLTKTDKILEASCLVAFVGLWIGTIAVYPKLPEQIPTHFNAAGKADDFSYKRTLFILPAIATVIYAGMTFLNKYPHLYNYLRPVTTENAKQLYISASRWIRWLKLIVVLVFCAIVFVTCNTIFTNSTSIGTWFLPIVIIVLLLPTIFYLTASFRQKTQQA